MKNILLLSLLLGVLSSCSLWERKHYEYTYRQINENEIEVDFAKINPGTWDTLLLIPPYISAEQINLDYLDNEFLEQKALDDSEVIGAFLKNEKLIGYTACGRHPIDFIRLFEDLDSGFVLKIPRSQAVFGFIRNEDGRYQLKK